MGTDIGPLTPGCTLSPPGLGRRPGTASSSWWASSLATGVECGGGYWTGTFNVVTNAGGRPSTRPPGVACSLDVTFSATCPDAIADLRVLPGHQTGMATPSVGTRSFGTWRGGRRQRPA